MNFDFSEDQKLLKEQVSRFLQDKCSLDVARSILESNEQYSKEVWKGLVDLGLTGTTIPEEYGGLGLGALELCVIAEELGRFAAPVPFSSSVYLATEAIKLYGTSKQKELWLPKLASGEIIATFALSESASEPSEKNINTTIIGNKLNGKKLPVPDGSYADICVVVVRDKDSNTISLALVEMNSKGITKNELKTLINSVIND